jgi:hypothetical protein
MNIRYVKEIKFTTKSRTNKYEKIAVGPAIIVLTKKVIFYFSIVSTPIPNLNINFILPRIQIIWKLNLETLHLGFSYNLKILGFHPLGTYIRKDKLYQPHGKRNRS